MYKKSEDKLIRFVWSRRIEYDYVLLVEVQEKNPYAFKNSKAIWDDIAKNLQMGELKMKVTHRSCKGRVNELLKKFRKDEGIILRSTGATDDKITDIKKLLEIINEMALTKPKAMYSNLYTKRARTEGESVIDAALTQLSDSEPDDYIHGKDTHGHSSKPQRNNEEIEYVNDVNGFFNDQEEECEFEMQDSQVIVITNNSPH